VTHPFHPLCGQELKLVDYRTAWGEDRVYVHDDAGQLLRLSAAWTDSAEPDAFVVAARGRSVMHGDDLLRLAEWAAGVAEAAAPDCKRNDAASGSKMMPKQPEKCRHGRRE
jgi:hypothetical protein